MSGRMPGVWGAVGIALVVVATLFWWNRLQRVGHVTQIKANELPVGAAWSHEFDAVSDLAAVGSALVASVVIAEKPYLVGLDAAGGLKWRSAMPGPAMLVASGRVAFVAVEDRIMTIDPTDGTISATKSVHTPLSQRTAATTLVLGEDLLIVDARRLERLSGVDLQALWTLTSVLEEQSEALQQLAYESPRIVAVSNLRVMVISEHGELLWKRQLPADSRLAGDHPVVVAHGRVWVGLVRLSDPGARYLYGFSVSDGGSSSKTSIGDLAMYCPAHFSNGVLVLDTQRGLAGFDIEKDLARRWSIEAPIAPGACVSQNNHVLVATTRGEVVRIMVADGKKEVLVRLPRTQVWVPPAPDLPAGIHSESEGVIEHLAYLPEGVAFSVVRSRDRAAIQFNAW
jgi:hypothetical protein